jgi:hypothetical protein
VSLLSLTPGDTKDPHTRCHYCPSHQVTLRTLTQGVTMVPHTRCHYGPSHVTLKSKVYSPSHQVILHMASAVNSVWHYLASAVNNCDWTRTNVCKQWSTFWHLQSPSTIYAPPTANFLTCNQVTCLANLFCQVYYCQSHHLPPFSTLSGWLASLYSRSEELSCHHLLVILVTTYKEICQDSDQRETKYQSLFPQNPYSNHLKDYKPLTPNWKSAYVR